jgi:hypothetical protein
MGKSFILDVCAASALLIASNALAAETPHTLVYKPQMLPQLYVAASDAQAACPDDQVVWVNWSARKSHLSDDRYYGHTSTGAYACARPSAMAGVKPAH